MRATMLLPMTAAIVTFACAKADQTSRDTSTVTAKSQTTGDSISAKPPDSSGAKTVATAPTTPAVPVAASPANRPATTAPAKSTTKPSVTPSSVSPAPPSATKTGAVAAPPVVPAPTKPEASPPVSAPPAAPVSGGATATTGDESQGKEPYEEFCRKCHGVRGVPPKTMKAKYSKIPTFDAAFFVKHSQDSIVTVLTKGKNEDMKSFKDKLSPEQMKAVAAYIRTFAM
jgi:mono/diheme cytochrome c family protein